jgi:hypothetical protein
MDYRFANLWGIKTQNPSVKGLCALTSKISNHEKAAQYTKT